MAARTISVYPTWAKTQAGCVCVKCKKELPCECKRSMRKRKGTPKTVSWADRGGSATANVRQSKRTKHPAQPPISVESGEEVIDIEQLEKALMSDPVHLPVEDLGLPMDDLGLDLSLDPDCGSLPELDPTIAMSAEELGNFVAALDVPVSQFAARLSFEDAMIATINAPTDSQDEGGIAAIAADLKSEADMEVEEEMPLYHPPRHQLRDLGANIGDFLQSLSA